MTFFKLINIKVWKIEKKKSKEFFAVKEMSKAKYFVLFFIKYNEKSMIFIGLSQKEV